MKRASLSLALIFLLPLVLAESVPDSLNLNLQVTDSSGNPTTGTYSFVFSLTNRTDCTNAFYSVSTTLTTDSRGIISYTLTNVNSTFDQKTYLCYYRDGVLKSNVSVSQVPNAFKAKNVTVSGLIADANLNLSQKNVSADWFNGKLNYSDIQNHPVFLTQAAANLLYCKLTGCTITGDLIVPGNICNSTACFTLSELNRSGSASESDPLSIHKDGSTTTTDMIDFEQGISTRNYVFFGESASYSESVDPVMFFDPDIHTLEISSGRYEGEGNKILIVSRADLGGESSGSVTISTYDASLYGGDIALISGAGASIAGDILLRVNEESPNGVLSLENVRGNVYFHTNATYFNNDSLSSSYPFWINNNNGKLCNSTACFTLSELNRSSSSSSSESDPLSIYKNGSTTTTASIPFAEGLSTPSRIHFNTNPNFDDDYAWINYYPDTHIFELFAGNGLGSNSQGNDAIIKAGSANGTANAGGVQIIGGDTGNGIGGSVTISSGGGLGGVGPTKAGDIVLLVSEQADTPGGIYLTNDAKKGSVYINSNRTLFNNDTYSSSYPFWIDHNNGKLCNETNSCFSLSELNQTNSFFSSNVNVTKNITIGSLGNPGCISIRDSDDGGWSHLQMLDGAIVNGSGAC